MWGRATAGLFPGFVLAAALTGLLGWMLPGPWQASLVPCLVMFFPLWTAIASASFLFVDGKRAWTWIGTAAVLTMSLLWLLQGMGWIR